jgi:hypothetical protein
MAVNLNALSANTTAATAISALVLVTPQTQVGYQPQNSPNADGSASTAQNPPSILFNYEGEQTVSIESDITDHYVEDNTAIQDQIALKPEIITTHGFIGELNDVAPFGLQTAKLAAEKLTTITGYTPQLSETATLAYNEAFFAYQLAQSAVNSAVSAWSSLAGGEGQQTKQQIYFQQFYGYWKSRTLFKVQTPYGIFQDMAIQRLRAIQDDQTRTITDFEVTFKKIRTATTFLIASQISYSGRLNSQAGDLINQGTTSGTPSISMAQGLVNMGVA